MSTIGARLREWGNAEILNWLRLVPVQVFGVWKEENEGYVENVFLMVMCDWTRVMILSLLFYIRDREVSSIQTYFFLRPRCHT